MNLPLSENQAGVLYDILNVYFNFIYEELENTDDRTHAYHLLEQRKSETEDLINEFDAMIQRRNVKG
jgi:hypothetical protein